MTLPKYLYSDHGVSPLYDVALIARRYGQFETLWRISLSLLDVTFLN